VPLPKMSEAMDGRREAHMGKASVYEAELHAQPNDSNLRLLAGPRRGACSGFWEGHPVLTVTKRCRLGYEGPLQKSGSKPNIPRINIRD
jgi:hypothetical protein